MAGAELDAGQEQWSRVIGAPRAMKESLAERRKPILWRITKVESKDDTACSVRKEVLMHRFGR